MRSNPEVFLPKRDPENEKFEMGSASEQRQRLIELERILNDMYMQFGNYHNWELYIDAMKLKIAEKQEKR